MTDWGLKYIQCKDGTRYTILAEDCVKNLETGNEHALSELPDEHRTEMFRQQRWAERNL